MRCSWFAFLFFLSLFVLGAIICQLPYNIAINIRKGEVYFLSLYYCCVFLVGEGRDRSCFFYQVLDGSGQNGISVFVCPLAFCCIFSYTLNLFFPSPSLLLLCLWFCFASGIFIHIHRQNEKPARFLVCSSFPLFRFQVGGQNTGADYIDDDAGGWLRQKKRRFAYWIIRWLANL